MSETESEPTTDDRRTTAGDEGFTALVGQAAQEKREQQERLTEAEKQKRKIMRERGEVDDDAPPIHIEHDSYEFAFSPMPKKVRVWAENTMFDFIGFDEEAIQDDPERAAGLRSVKDKTAATLDEYSLAAEYDAGFWGDFFGVEERMTLISSVLDRQDEREGNRR